MLDTGRINADVQNGLLEWWQDWLKSRGIKGLRKAVVGSERYTDWKASDQYNLITVLNPLTSWQDSLYLASLSLIPSWSLFYLICFTLLKQAATWSRIVVLFPSFLLRGKAGRGNGCNELWRDLGWGQKGSFSISAFRRGFTTQPPFSIVNFSLLCILSVQVAVRVHAYESLTSHPHELWKNKTLRELENCFSLFTLHSTHLLHVKCLRLEHHL